MTIARIAKERGFVRSTIEGHLSFFVENGQLDIGKTLSPEKQRAIEKALDADPRKSLNEVKLALGNDYSHGEIKLVMGHRKNQAVRAGIRKSAKQTKTMI